MAGRQVARIGTLQPELSDSVLFEVEGYEAGAVVKVRLMVVGGVLVVVAASFYIPVYLYKAMRTVYGQGHILTFAKYVALAVAYILGASLTMLGVVLFALFSL